MTDLVSVTERGELSEKGGGKAECLRGLTPPINLKRITHASNLETLTAIIKGLFTIRGDYTVIRPTTGFAIPHNTSRKAVRHGGAVV